MLGRQDEAIRNLSSIDDRAEHLALSFTSSLRLLLEGKLDESVRALDPLLGIGDPEARYFVARHLAFAGEPKAALNGLEWAVDNGFFCAPAFGRDPWLDPLRNTPEFGAIMRRAEARHRDAVVTFLSAEGDRVLGLGQPA